MPCHATILINKCDSFFFAAFPFSLSLSLPVHIDTGHSTQCGQRRTFSPPLLFFCTVCDSVCSHDPIPSHNPHQRSIDYSNPSFPRPPPVFIFHFSINISYFLRLELGLLAVVLC